MSGRPAPPKPWEQRRASGTASPGNSAVENLPKPWEQQSSSSQPGGIVTVTPTGSTTSQPARPWDTATTNTNPSALVATTSYGGGYGTNSSMYNNTNSMYSRPYGGMYGGNSSMYAGGNNMYGGGGSMYSRPMYGGYGGSSMYGGGGYGSYGGYGGGSMYGGGYGMMGGGGYGGMMQDPNNPHMNMMGFPGPPSPYQAMVGGVSSVVGFLGRLSFLVGENTHALSFFLNSLLAVLENAGSLYAELARFVLRLLGFGKKKGGDKNSQQMVPSGPANTGGHSNFDGVWGSK